MKHLLAAAFLTGTLILAATPETIPLFPKGVPGSKPSGLGPEKDMTTGKDNLVMGRPVMRLGNVSEPSLAFYPAASGKNTGAAVIVFPGGGYRILAYDLEGSEVCEWLNSIGVNAILVKYRVPEPEGMPRYQEPLQDAQRAVGYVRAHAQTWHLDAQRIGVLGFSAGGHLSAMISNNFTKRSYDVQDEADSVSCRPDFTILIYPAYLAAGDHLDSLAPELTITSHTPPTFVVQTEDDPVHVENSLIYYRALKEQNVAAEMHIFSAGGHGYGLRPDPQKPVTRWPSLVEEWLRARHLVDRK